MIVEYSLFRFANEYLCQTSFLLELFDGRTNLRDTNDDLVDTVERKIPVFAYLNHALNSLSYYFHSIQGVNRFNDPAVYLMEIPAANGVGTGRGLVEIFSKWLLGQGSKLVRIYALLIVNNYEALI